MNYSFKSVLLYCAVFLPKCIYVYLCDIFIQSGINKTPIPSLTIIGVLLQMRTIQTMRGILTSTMATRTTTIRQITIMFVVLGQESTKKGLYV